MAFHDNGMILGESLDMTSTDGVTLVLGSSYDTGFTTRRSLDAEDLYLVITIVETPSDEVSSITVVFDAVTDSDPDLGSPTILASSAAYATTALVPGFRIVLPVQGFKNIERYIGLQMTPTGDDIMDIGTLDAYLTNQMPTWVALPDAVN